MGIFTGKVNVMDELTKEKNFLWSQVNKQKEEIDYLLKKVKSISDNAESNAITLAELEKSAPEHYANILTKSRSATGIHSDIKKKSELVKSAALSMNEYHEKILEIRDEAELKDAEITDCYNKLKSDITKIQDTNSEAAEAESVIQDHLEELDKMREMKSEILSDLNQINDEKELAIEQFSKIKELLRTSIQERNEIKRVYNDVYGYDAPADDEDEDSEIIRVKGKAELLEESYRRIDGKLEEFYKDGKERYNQLNVEIENINNKSVKQFDDYIKSCSDDYSDVKKKINDLLPAAMTAGLAAAYDKKIEMEAKELIRHDTSFRMSIALLVSCSFTPFIIAYFFVDQSTLTFNELINQVKSFLPFIVPIYTPILWLAYSANKKYKLSKRLIEEYTHKGVISKTFEGLSTQVQNMPDSKMAEELRIKLLYNLVDVNSENPGKLISDYNKSDHPLMDALDKSAKLADSVTKLSRIPGFSAIVKHLDDKGKNILAEQDRKVSGALGADVDISENAPNKA
ncbi:hypothetical protein [Moritella viscosa]|uniref:hypothetical protein n=1 Tax=Moritella viscosa TaxID=80854 RepID=UPI00091DFDDE|nr:hypothetical protein [Moritella viscosa]SGY81448.1 Putative uncharacterized protein [Moritella viscosa]